MTFEELFLAYDEHIKKFVVSIRFADVFRSLRAALEEGLDPVESLRILHGIQLEIFDSRRAGFEPESHKLLHEVHVAVGMQINRIGASAKHNKEGTV